MGSNFATAIIPPCPVNELRKRFSDLVDQARHEHGAGGYSGSFAEKDSVVADSKICATPQEASDYLSEKYDDKWGPAGAVRIVHGYGATLPDSVTSFDEKLRKHRQDLSELPRNALLKIKTQKSRTRSCLTCGSAIAVQHLRSTACPVCHDPKFALSKGDAERLKKLEGRIVELMEAQQAAGVQWSKEVVAKASANPSTLQWFVGAWCSC